MLVLVGSRPTTREGDFSGLSRCELESKTPFVRLPPRSVSNEMDHLATFTLEVINGVDWAPFF